MIQKIAKWYLIRWWYIRCDHSRSFKSRFYHMQLDYHDGLVQFLKSNIQNISKKGIFRWQWCWWHRYVSDISIGHQHHNMPECDVGDRYLILVPNSRCWWRDLSPTSKSRKMGYIDVGDGCWRPNVLVTKFGRCWQVKSPTSRVRHQHQISVTNITFWHIMMLVTD